MNERFLAERNLLKERGEAVAGVAFALLFEGGEGGEFSFVAIVLM